MLTPLVSFESLSITAVVLQTYSKLYDALREVAVTTLKKKPERYIFLHAYHYKFIYTISIQFYYLYMKLWTNK